MRQQVSAIFGGKKVEMRQTPRAVPSNGGLAVFVEFLRKIDYAGVVRQALPFELRSPNAIDPAQTLMAFLAAVVPANKSIRAGFSPSQRGPGD